MPGFSLGGVVLAVIGGAIRVSTPFLYVSLGECITEKSGRINLGLEGILVMGAVTGYALSYVTGNAWVGVLGAAGLSLGDQHLRPFRPANTRQSPDPRAPALGASSIYRQVRPEETAMHPSSTISYDLAQARIADLRHQARREGLARAAARSTQPDRTRVPGRLHRPVRWHRAAPAAGPAPAGLWARGRARGGARCWGGAP